MLASQSRVKKASQQSINWCHNYCHPKQNTPRSQRKWSAWYWIRCMLLDIHLSDVMALKIHWRRRCDWSTCLLSHLRLDNHLRIFLVEEYWTRCSCGCLVIMLSGCSCAALQHCGAHDADPRGDHLQVVVGWGAPWQPHEQALKGLHVVPAEDYMKWNEELLIAPSEICF